MSKQSGLGDNLYIHGYDLSGDINSLGNVGGVPGRPGADRHRQGGVRTHRWHA
ncbi:hypothetical protein RB200_19440 [Streptomyces sp. PmtG]